MMTRVRRVILASASPRRRTLLQAACWDVDVRPANVDESWAGTDLKQGAMVVATRKLEAVMSRLEGGDVRPVLAADTMVVLDGEALGKPVSPEDAIVTLRRLSGHTHNVITGFSLGRGDRRNTGAVVTEVAFREISLEEIKRYVDSGESLDKAGAYGIQGGGGAFVERLHGSYTNVVGLPLAEVLAAMEALDGDCGTDS